MSIELFVTSLALTLAVVATALIYLRGITRRVLQELCASEAGAEYWLRTTDVLALAGSLVLVIAFGGAMPGGDPIAQIRLTLGLALAGVFIAVVFVSSSVWRNVRDASSRADTVSAR